jgi:hypothetical protein
MPRVALLNSVRRPPSRVAALIEAAAQQAIVYEIAADYLRRTGLEATLFLCITRRRGHQVDGPLVPRRWAPTSGERVAAWLHAQTTAKDE